LEFNQTINDWDAWTRQFEEHGYVSVYMLQNLSENFMNLVSVIFASGIVMFVELLTMHLNK